MIKDVKSAVRWSAVDVIFRQGFGLIVLVILARILSPEDFGLMAMIAVFIAMASIFSDAGFSQALIQRANPTHTDESTIFFFNVLMSILMALTLFAISTQVSEFFERAILKDMLVVLSLNLVVNALGTIHITLLSKKLSFDVIAKAGIISTIISGVVAVTLALMGWGVWSLVVQAVTSSLINLFLLWSLHSWRPCLTFSFQTIRSYLSFGGNITLAALMYVIQQHIYAMVIGKSYNASDAGLYSRSYGLMQLPILLLTNIVSRVAFPVFSAAKNDREKLVKGLKKALVSVMFLSLPITVLMLLLAGSIVKVMLGDQWLGAVPVLQVLSLAAMLMPIQMLNINILKALGHADINLRLVMIKFIVAMTVLFIVLPYGLVAVAYGFVSCQIFNVFLNTYYSYIFLDYGILKQIKEITPYALASSLMGVVILSIQYTWDLVYWMELIVCVLVGSLVYMGVCVLFKLEATGYLLSLMKRNQ